MQPNKHYIIVNVPDGKNTAFIAMPFTDAFEELYKSIITAVTSADLMPSRVDKNPEDTNFIKDITKQIRSARLIIAVCSPEPNSDHINPNVMYELGLAHSIGKCTIILSSDTGVIPADLRAEQILSYKPGEEKKQDFINKLTNRLNVAKNWVKEDGYTSKHYNDIFAAEPKHWMHLYPKLWDDCVTIISFAQDVLQQFQILDSAYIGPFGMKAEKVATEHYQNPEALSLIKIDCQKAWDNYKIQYNNLFMQQLPERQEQVKDAFKTLLSEADRSAKSLLSKSNGFCTEIVSELKRYHEIHTEISDRANLGILVEQFEDSAQLWYKTTKLSQAATCLVSLSISLVRNIIQIFLDRKVIK